MATLVVVGSGGPDATFTLTRVEGREEVRSGFSGSHLQGDT